jgi:bla regulator protein blaR1
VIWCSGDLAVLTKEPGARLRRQEKQSMRYIGVLVFCGYALLASSPAAVSVRAQAPQAVAAPEFDAATVKRSEPDAQGQRLGFQPGGRFTAQNVPLRLFISAAYGTPQPLPPFQVLGGPDWLDKDRFDIVAKAAGDPAPGPNGPPPIMFQMMQTLLADRFKLKVHRETRDQPIYALVLANGKSGAKLRASPMDCQALMNAARNGAPSPPGSNPPFCGLRASPGRVQASGSSVTMFANSLSRNVNRPIQDRTGLQGDFDFELEWTPDQMPAGRDGAPSPGALPPPPTDGPSLFTALQEQLGLKLESTRGSVDVLVIDSVERPTEN